MRDAENVYLERLGADYAGDLMEDGISFTKLKELLVTSKIDLEMEKDNVTWVMSESLLGEIEKAMPDLLKIAKKPRSFIESHDEKMLVESASKIGHKAIAQLSRDSKDWYARTFVSVKPKNITAEVTNETFSIYENKVFVSLIKRLDKDIYAKKKDAEAQLRKQEQSVSSKTIDDYLNLSGNDSSAWSFNLYKRAIWTKPSGSDDEDLKEIRTLCERIDKISKQLSRIKTSKVYKDLARTKKESSPILRTNIFLYDKRYKTVLSLWKELDSDKFSKSEDLKDKVIDTQQAEINYGLYVLLSIAYAFGDLGYEATNNSGCFFYDYDDAYVDKPVVFVRAGHTFKLTGHSKDNCFKLTYSSEDQKEKDRDYILHINYENFEDLGLSDFDDKTKSILNSTKIEKRSKFGEPIHHISFISFDGAGTSLGDNLSEKLAHRILSFGDSFSYKEAPNDLANWGNYQTGFLDICPQKDFRNNLLKIERLINHISVEKLSLSELKKTNNVCPLCGHETLKKISTQDTDYSCYNCTHLIAYTSHKGCSLSSGKSFLWVMPSNTNFLAQQKENFHFRGGQNLFVLYQFTQFVFGKFATTGFEVGLDPKGEIEYNTICPSCGKVMK